MSSSLVRKALDLLESDLEAPQDLKKRGLKDESKKNLKHKKKSLVKQQKRILGDDSSEAALEVEQARKRVRAVKDNTAHNLQQLDILTQVRPVSSKRATKILQQTVKTRQLIDESAPDESTCFTEEDFKKFEEEYFLS